MTTKVHYKGESISLQEFCNNIGFNIEVIKSYAQENNVTLTEATIHYFPKMYINLLGELVAPDDSSEKVKIKEAILTISKKGIPCLWEWGGGWTKTGNAMVIADYEGRMKKAIYIPRHGNLCNDGHALIPVRNGDYLVFAERAQGVMSYQVEQIDNIDIENEVAKCVVLDTIPTYLDDAIKAVIAKCDDYHCRDVYFSYM